MKLIQKLKEKARQLKSEVQVLIMAYGDKRTPLAAKILIGITIGYLLSPIDLIPDFIPVLGLLDDIIIVPFLIRLSIKQIPEVVLQDARAMVVSHSKRYKKNNWFFASIIIAIWLTILYMFYNLYKNFWSGTFDL